MSVARSVFDMKISRAIWRSLLWVILFSALCGALAISLLAPVHAAPLAQHGPELLVISQIYGGGGNAGAFYTHDFIEIFNPTDQDISLDGLSVQYAAPAGSRWTAVNLSGLLKAGQYYLIQGNSGGSVGTALPVPDVISNININANNGKVALVDSIIELTCNGDNKPCSPSEIASIIDLVGYGTATFSEGPYHPADALNAKKSSMRIDSCVDTDDNKADFKVADPMARNKDSIGYICGVGPYTPTETPNEETLTVAAGNTNVAATETMIALSAFPTTATPTPSRTLTPSRTPSPTRTPSLTRTPSPTRTPSLTRTSSPTRIPSLTRTPTITYTPTNTKTPTKTITPSRTPTAAPIQLVAINEFVPRPGRDWNNDGLINTGDEYIELINYGATSVNLSGWTLDDEVNTGSTPYRISSLTLRPGERIVFYGNQTGLLLSDGGDAVRLLKPNGGLTDAFDYNVVNYPDQSFCRLPDKGGLGLLENNCYPTPGLPNSLGSAPNASIPLINAALCPIADTLPQEFHWAECDPFGNAIWSRRYWDDTGWYGELRLPNINGKWDVFAD